MRFGYLKDTGDMDWLLVQKKALQTAGAEKLFTDRLYTPKAIRPALRQLKCELRPGDIVMVQSLPCLGRNIHDLLEQLKAIEERGAVLVSLKEHIDTAEEAGALLPAILDSLLHFDRNMSNFWNPSGSVQKKQRESAPPHQE